MIRLIIRVNNLSSTDVSRVSLLRVTMRIVTYDIVYRTRRVTHLRQYDALGKRERIGAIIVRRKIGVSVGFGSITDGFGIAKNPYVHILKGSGKFRIKPEKFGRF